MRWFKLNKDQRKQYDGFLKTLQGLTDADKSPNYAYIVKDSEKSILFATDGVSCAWWNIPPEIQPLFENLGCLSYSRGAILEEEPVGTPPVLGELIAKHWKDDSWTHLNNIPSSKKSRWAGLHAAAYGIGGNLINSEYMEALNPVADKLEMIRSVSKEPIQMSTSDGSFCVMVMPMGNVELCKKES